MSAHGKMDNYNPRAKLALRREMLVDNYNPRAKLALRREMLRRYHAGGPLHVFDAFQGEARLWSVLRCEFPCATYWGVDVIPKKGRFKIDSLRILDQPGLRANVIDLDAYGSPWKHWLAILAHVTQPATVFLTVGLPPGAHGAAAGNMDKLTRAALGLDRLRVVPAMALLHSLATWAMGFMLGQPSAHGLRVLEAIEALNPGGSARYVAVRLGFPHKNLHKSL